MRRFAALLLAAFLLSGCQVLTKQKLKPVPATLSHAQLVHAANHWCEHDRRRAKHLKNPRNTQMLERDFGIALSSTAHLIFHLRGLAPPPSDALAYRRLLATANDQELVATHLVQAIEEGQIHYAKGRARRLDVLDKRFSARARALGLKVCAKR
jgi:hypothetical protein